MTTLTLTPASVTTDLSFPIVPVADDFNRAKEGPPATGWTTPFGAGWKVLSNQFVPNAADAYAQWGTSQSADLEAYVTISTMPDINKGVRILARFDPSTQTGYSVLFVRTAGNDTLMVERATGGFTFTTIASSSSFNLNVSGGDALGIRCIGTTIQGWVKTTNQQTTGGTWQQFASATDTTYAGTGSNNKVVLYTNTAVGAYDNFGGGSLQTASALTTTSQSASTALTLTPV